MKGKTLYFPHKIPARLEIVCYILSGEHVELVGSGQERSVNASEVPLLLIHHQRREWLQAPVGFLLLSVSVSAGCASKPLVRCIHT